jgi:MoxR-like ATPase
MSPETDHLKDVLGRARTEIGKIIIGQQQVIDQALTVILVGQHALIEGVPGVGKTILVRTLARILGCDYGRVQFTPDLMPADITGTNVFNLKTNEFNIIRGPIFTTFLLADEINRAPAKTQSALLQAMQERAVTIDRETHRLSPNFTVFATQNPIEYEGTYTLPEAQKDRFMLKIEMGPLEHEEELALARLTLEGQSPDRVLGTGSVEPVIQNADLQQLRKALETIVVRPELVEYIVQIVRRTRDHDGILVGAGPRATQSMALASRANAALDGRDFDTPDDVRAMVTAVLEHRVILRPEHEIEGITARETIESIVQAVPVPR